MIESVTSLPVTSNQFTSDQSTSNQFTSQYLLINKVVLGAARGLIYLGISYIVNAIVFLLITQLWKISLHCGVVAGCVTALAYIVTPKRAFLFFLIPVVAWARIQKKRHTLIQTLAGTIIAIIVTKLPLLSL